MNKCNKCNGNDLELKSRKDKNRSNLWENYWYCHDCDRKVDIRYVFTDEEILARQIEVCKELEIKYPILPKGWSND